MLSYTHQDELQKKVYNNFCNMLSHRGYDLSKLRKIESNLGDVYFLEEKDDSLSVLMCDKLNKDLIVNFYNTLDDAKGIIIYKKLTKKELAKKLFLPIELFNESFFYLDITKGKYFRKHIKMDSAPYKKEDLLKMKTTDPVCRYYNFKEDDIILVDDIEYNIVVSGEYISSGE